MRTMSTTLSSQFFFLSNAQAAATERRTLATRIVAAALFKPADRQLFTNALKLELGLSEYILSATRISLLLQEMASTRFSNYEVDFRWQQYKFVKRKKTDGKRRIKAWGRFAPWLSWEWTVRAVSTVITKPRNGGIQISAKMWLKNMKRNVLKSQ